MVLNVEKTKTQLNFYLFSDEIIIRKLFQAKIINRDSGEGKRALRKTENSPINTKFWHFRQHRESKVEKTPAVIQSHYLLEKNPCSR